MKAIKTTHNETHGAEARIEVRTIGDEGSMVVVGIGAVTAALVGMWGFCCLVGGIVSAGGVADLARGYLSAVTGG